MKDWDRHIEELFACRACPEVAGVPVTGAVRGARVLLLGQAPGPREGDEQKPFAWTAGKRLFTWFDRLGVSENAFRESVHIAAAIRCFPGRAPKGGDRVPSPQELERCGAHLDREIRILRPKLVIAVGTLAAELLVGKMPLVELVGRTFRGSRVGVFFDVIVLPHPSGRSTWLNHPLHKERFESSLQLIGKHPAWKETFRSGEDLVGTGCAGPVAKRR